ncbi:pyrroloquinoline quinone-dependent dehydrogenase [Beijerinckia indica]|uniref:Pyrrolo-quinoline quinone n=1 Tax=Beijerinckia indica subsp. indica (strain ATCC 9039 / DSM 1715 / NCIMB 8712) TaxID=395963 RepID=B2II30_BEII9|nr:PQQ-binding-like beta-propeller repeat protein [Beijerinckia indica]ACB94613.1 Pyrrolo-quinoline quinone [Beijerinckia indica subsp. indica ATCC 9039]
MSAKAFAFGSVSILSLATGAALAAGPTQQELNNATTDSANWPYVDHDYRGQRYTPLDQINAKNAADLTQICAYSFPEKMPAQTAPIVYNGTIFATTTHYTVAIDGANCKVIWQSEWKPRDHETFVTHRGAAIKDGKVVRGTADGYLLALDAETGKVLWSRQVVKPSDGYFFSMPPLIYDDLVLIGPAGSEFASKGWVGAFRLSDGEPVWTFNTVPDPDEPGAETWGSDPNVLKHGGGNLWTPMSFDVEKGLLYVPVGNPAPDFYDKNRPGDNLYTDSVVALDVRTGKLAWYYQAIPHDVRDYDLSHAAPVFTIEVDGQKRTLIALNGKDGLMQVLDRDTRKVLYSVPFTTRENADGPISSLSKRICPGLLGGHEWNGGAYSPQLSTLFMPATDWCNQIQPAAEQPNPEGENKRGQFFGGKFQFEPWANARGWLTAFDAATGQKRWQYQSGKPIIGSVAATGGDLVFVGELTGDFLAFDAKDGKIVFKHSLGGPAAGGVVSYASGAKQYVAVVSGFVGGYYNQMAPEIGGGNPTITVFALKP